MGMLENRFRGKFERQADGYRFRQWGREVRFSAAEVEDMVARWRFYWANPVFWFGWLALGLLAPFLLDRSNLAGGSAMATVLAVTVNIAMAVLLVHGERLPNAAAETRVIVEHVQPAARRMDSAVLNLLVIGVALAWLFDPRDSRHYDLPKWVWWLIIAFNAWSLLKRLVAWLRLRRAGTEA